MNQPNSELESWLSGGDLVGQQLAVVDQWVAGFDPDRQVVVLKLGPYKKLYLRPAKFTRRFFHQLHPLSVESWPHRWQIPLFDDFCTLDVELDLRFQATLQYVHRHTERVDAINSHIQQLYAEVVADIVNRELQNLADGHWVRKGLIHHEKRIALDICEFMTMQQIQAEANCRMTATFAEFPDVQLGKDSVYVNVLRKTFELNQEKSRELLRQQRIAEQMELQEQHRQREHQQQLLEMQRKIQQLEAEAQVQLLLDKERQLANQREIERRLHADQVLHQQQLHEIGFDIESQAQQQLQAKQRLLEAQQIAEQLAHQAHVEDKKILAEIERRQAALQRWQEAGLQNDAVQSGSSERRLG
jgi:hypothetical protein